MTNFKNIIIESIERFVPHKILRKNSNPEYYNKEVRKLKIMVRKSYIRRKLGQQYGGEPEPTIEAVAVSQKMHRKHF
jgi:hypothetical protein